MIYTLDGVDRESYSFWFRLGIIKGVMIVRIVLRVRVGMCVVILSMVGFSELLANELLTRCRAVLSVVVELFLFCVFVLPTHVGICA